LFYKNRDQEKLEAKERKKEELLREQEKRDIQSRSTDRRKCILM
jgi:hypothetical protein